jgi:hypothetical protein
MLPLAISNPFCRLGSPDGVNLCLSANAVKIACGLPVQSGSMSNQVSTASGSYDQLTSHFDDHLCQSVP